MITLSELVAVVAEVEGMPEPTVAQVARHLREAGLIFQSGSGLSAARNTMTDAASLLIGVNASPVAQDAPKVVAWYRGMVNYMRSPSLDTLGESSLERDFLAEIAFVAEESAAFGDVLANLLLMGAQGRLRKFLHHIALVDIATNPDPFQRSLADLRFGNQTERVRRTTLGGDADEIAALRDELRPDLDNLIRLSVSTVAVRFCRPYPGACIEVRRGASNATGKIEGGRLLLNASFELDFDDDAILAEEDRFHGLRYLARSEVVTIDQRALVAIGELLAETSDGAHHDAGNRPLRLPAGLGFA